MLPIGLEEHQFAYLTTVGRVTGRPHRIEIWFAVVDEVLWVNSGGGRRSEWVKNLVREPRLGLEVGDRRWAAVATVRDDLHEHPARRRLAERYQGWRPGQPLSAWATNGLLIEIEVVDG